MLYFKRFLQYDILQIYAYKIEKKSGNNNISCTHAADILTLI